MKLPSGSLKESCLQAPQEHLRPKAVTSLLEFHSAQLKSVGFLQMTSDPCIYRDSGGEPFFIRVYVDDIILAGNSPKRMKEVKEALARKVDIKDMDRLHYFLGIKVTQDEETGDVLDWAACLHRKPPKEIWSGRSQNSQ